MSTDYQFAAEVTSILVFAAAVAIFLQSPQIPLAGSKSCSVVIATRLKHGMHTRCADALVLALTWLYSIVSTPNRDDLNAVNVRSL